MRHVRGPGLTIVPPPPRMTFVTPITSVSSAKVHTLNTNPPQTPEIVQKAADGQNGQVRPVFSTEDGLY